MLALVFVLAAGVAMAADASSVTFNKDVLPIVQKNCQICHRPGEAAPMSFLTYESTRPWAKAMKAAVLAHKMPPWHPDPRYGHFLNDRRLSDSDIQTLVTWVDAGAPEGDAKDKPAPVRWTEGWNIRPDVVLEMTKAYTVPAKGTIPWLDFIVPTNFKEDTWVVAGEVRPGAHRGSSREHQCSARGTWIEVDRIREIRRSPAPRSRRRIFPRLRARPRAREIRR